MHMWNFSSTQDSIAHDAYWKPGIHSHLKHASTKHRYALTRQKELLLSRKLIAVQSKVMIYHTIL